MSMGLQRTDLFRAGLLEKGGVISKVKNDSNNTSQIKNEKELQKQIYQFLNLRSIFPIWHRMDKRSHCTPGTPDFVFAVRGQAIGIEAKTETGKLSAEQIAAHKMMESNGWLIAIVRSIHGLKFFLDVQLKDYEKLKEKK